MTSQNPRRDDPARPDHRRHRSATVPSQSYDPRVYDRYNDPRQPSRPRQDPNYPSYHPPPPSKAYQHATRPSAQHVSSAYHPQPTYHPVASSSRRQHVDADPRTARRPPLSAHQHPHDQLSSGEDIPRTTRHPSRAAHPPTQPPPSNHAFWNPREPSSRHHKDPYRDRERDQERERDRERDRVRERERERERDRPSTDLENKYKDRTRSDHPRERERTTDRHQEPSRTRIHERRKESDTEGVSYSAQRNVSRTSLSGREGHPPREPSSTHRRHRTEDATTGRRYHSENTQNPITMPSHSTSAPQPEVQQTGEPPPAPRVMPVYLPSKAKPQRSHREKRPSATHGAQSGSDTERATSKYRMERTPSGPAVQRSDGHAPNTTRERINHDITMGLREDVRRQEGKYAVHQETRPPLAPINVDIPLVTPGFNASTLPTETKVSTVPQIVSIRASQGPSDPHDAQFKSTILHSDPPQEPVVHPHPTSASIIKPSSHARLQSFETRVQSDRPVVLEHPRVEPRGDDLLPGERMSIHESSRAVPTQISKSHSYSRGNTETGVEHSYPHSRPPSRSAQRSSAAPPAVVGPRPLRSVSQGPQTNEAHTRPPSVAQYTPTAPPVLSRPSVPPSPVLPPESTPPKFGHTHGTPSSAQPSPKNAQLYGVSLSYSTSAQQTPSAPPSTYHTPAVIPQTFTSSSRPPTRESAHIDVSHTLQQSADRHPVDDRLGLQQAPNSTTVKASWVVQTPATAKRTKLSREEKYLREHHFNSETSRAQLRQVLSEDDDPFPRVSSSMMKASQATTPSASSRRNSPGSKARDVLIGTPRGTLGSNSPRSLAVKEPPTLEYAPKQNSSQPVGPPQIAVVGATPDSMVRDLPQNRVDHALLVPPFPAPPPTSRTTSSSRDHQPRPPMVRASSSSYQPQPVPAVHAPSMFLPYRPPSLSSSEDAGQFSPPPLPIPPPRSPEDSPPPPVEVRTSEIMPVRSQTDEAFQSHVHSIPEVQSEMFHIPSQPLLASATPPLAKLDSHVVPTPISNGPVTVAHADMRFVEPASGQPDNVQATRQDVRGPIPVLPSQSSSSSAKSRAKVTIEDVPEDSPVLTPVNAPTITPSAPSSRVQSSYHTIGANASSSSKTAVLDQTNHKSSPQSRSKDPPPHRNSDPSATPTFPPMPPPTSAAPTFTRTSSSAPPMPAPTSMRLPSSAPPTTPTFPASVQAAPIRTTALAAASRTHQRASEMLQANKLSSAVVGSGISANTNKSAAAPVQITSDAISPYQSTNGASVQISSVPKLANTSTTTPHPSTSATAPTAKAAAHLTSGSVLPAGALGPHISASSTNNNIQLPSIPDPPRQQPNRAGTLSIPTLDITSTSVMSTTPTKNAYEEHAIADSTKTRDVTPSANRHYLTPSSHVYPSSARPGTSSAITQQSHVASAQPLTHHRVVSLPIASSSSVAQRPLSPRKYSQPIPPTTVSTQPFPSRPSASESQSTRVPVVMTPAPARSTRLPPSDRMHDSDVLKTPSSIAPSPMLNSDTSNTLPQAAAGPIRVRKPSTESKDDKKPSGFFGLFRTRTLSSKAVDPPAVPTVTRASLDQGGTRPDVSAAAPTATTVPRGVTSTSAPKEWNSTTHSASTRVAPESKYKGRVPEPFTVPPPPTQAKEQRDATPHIFTPFKFLTMHSKRNRTVSAASLDVCDGNTATNTVVGSPDHSAISQAQPLPRIIPPDVRDPLVATSEWRERGEAERRERRTHRILRPGVTFDLGEEPPSPAPGAINKRKKLIRRPTGRAPTPGPPRG